MNSVFDWLQNEMSACKTRKFYLVDGLLSDDTRLAMENANLPMPPSYTDFISRFGNANLYRKGSIYLVQVFAAPRPEIYKEEKYLQFGRTDLALAYFKESLMVPERESSVFEWRHKQGVRKVADGFEEWLVKKCAVAKERFSKSEWEAIKLGPPAFSEPEEAVIEARRAFRWRVAGVAENGDILFEIHNGSRAILPYLSIGVRRVNGDVFGGIWLPISSVLPGQAMTIHKSCYKERYSPEEIEFFDLPDPSPEDRDRYWEFKGLK